MAKPEIVPYTSLDLNIEQDPRIIALMAEFEHTGFALYIMTILRLSVSENYRLDTRQTKALAYSMRIGKSEYSEFLNFCIANNLFKIEDEFYFYSESNRRRMAVKDNYTKTKSNNVTARHYPTAEIDFTTTPDVTKLQNEPKYQDLVNFINNNPDYSEADKEFSLTKALPSFYEHHTRNNWTDGKGKPVRNAVKLFEVGNKAYLQKWKSTQDISENLLTTDYDSSHLD